MLDARRSSLPACVRACERACVLACVYAMFRTHIMGDDETASRGSARHSHQTTTMEAGPA